jgi:2-hydroxy-6-oxo-6-(2'-aminophenyl)hexa-2,4-dienoate hydrolase
MQPALWTSRFVELRGVRTHYIEAGAADAPTIVLLHGGGAGADCVGNWRYALPLLARDFRVLAMDMVGFGRSDKPDPAHYSYSQTQRNAHLADFLVELGLQPAILVGNSMGGATALGVAMERPQLVRALVLMGSAGLNAEISDSLKPIVYYDFTPEGMHRLVEALTGPGYRADPELVRRRYELSVEPDARRAYEAIMLWIHEQGGLFYPEDALRAVTAPALLVNGKDDRVVPPRNAYRMLELLRNSWGYIVPHCGHWAMIEAPEDFALATRSFVLSKVLA